MISGATDIFLVNPQRYWSYWTVVQVVLFVSGYCTVLICYKNYQGTHAASISGCVAVITW